MNLAEIAEYCPIWPESKLSEDPVTEILWALPEFHPVKTAILGNEGDHVVN